MTEKVSFPKLPFIYELKYGPNNDDGIPNFLPFNLVIDKRYDLVKQEYNVLVDDNLSKAYKISSILGGNTTEDEIGIGYAKSILEFIKNNFSNIKKSIKVLDIGCGTGYLLSLLKEKGYDVYGIEPGLQANIGINKYKLPIIIDFFPSTQLNLKFDLIISSLVLEHIVEPEKFLIDIKKCLSKDGTVILGVPNTDPYVASGDISTLFHEHWSYFTTRSFNNFLVNNGAVNLKIEKSNYGGLLYAKFNFNESSDATQNIPDSNIEESASYFHKIQLATEKLKSFFYNNKNKTIGIYVPGRAVNFLISENILLSNVRFFDDNVNTNNHYFPGINILVENFDSLKKKPTDTVLVMSSFFGEQIKNKIVKLSSIEADNVITWEEIFES